MYYYYIIYLYIILFILLSILFTVVDVTMHDSVIYIYVLVPLVSSVCFVCRFKSDYLQNNNNNRPTCVIRLFSRSIQK